METKLGQFKKLKCKEESRLWKLSQLYYHSLKSFENENNFFHTPNYPLPFAVRNSMTNQFYQKKLGFRILKKKNASFHRDIPPGDSWPYLPSNLTTNIVTTGIPRIKDMNTPANFRQNSYKITKKNSKERTEEHREEIKRWTEQMSNLISENALLNKEIKNEVNNIM